jgi:hypothetical protein
MKRMEKNDDTRSITIGCFFRKCVKTKNIHGNDNNGN